MIVDEGVGHELDPDWQVVSYELGAFQHLARK